MEGIEYWHPSTIPSGPISSRAAASAVHDKPTPAVLDGEADAIEAGLGDLGVEPVWESDHFAIEILEELRVDRLLGERPCLRLDLTLLGRQ